MKINCTEFEKIVSVINLILKNLKQEILINKTEINKFRRNQRLNGLRIVLMIYKKCHIR